MQSCITFLCPVHLRALMLDLFFYFLFPLRTEGISREKWPRLNEHVIIVSGPLLTFSEYPCTPKSNDAESGQGAWGWTSRYEKAPGDSCNIMTHVHHFPPSVCPDTSSTDVSVSSSTYLSLHGVHFVCLSNHEYQCHATTQMFHTNGGEVMYVRYKVLICAQHLLYISRPLQPSPLISVPTLTLLQSEKPPIPIFPNPN